MTTKTITSVVEEIEDWQSQYGDIMYSVVAFAGNEMIKANKKSHDAALELQGLLKEAIGIPQEFALGEAGTSKAGNPKWKLMAFGPVDGPLTYSTLKDGKVPGDGHGVTSKAPPGDLPRKGPPSPGVRRRRQHPPRRSTQGRGYRCAGPRHQAHPGDGRRVRGMAQDFRGGIRGNGWGGYSDPPFRLPSHYFCGLGRR